MKLLLTGGGTLGSVTPLLAVAEEVKKQGGETVGWIGTRRGPEREFVEKAGIKFYAIPAAKLRRYFDLRVIFAPFVFLAGFFAAWRILRRLRPTIIFSGGSFVGVPVIFVGRMLGIPSVTHQQDARPSLANELAAGMVEKITIVFPESAKNFSKHKTELVGNPIRREILRADYEAARARFGLEMGVPTMLIFGGGTGAAAINRLVKDSLPELLTFAQIIHVTGAGKLDAPSSGRYHAFEILTEDMPLAYAAADLVVARAGVGTITELATLGKPSIIIPMPGTHQEDNAKMLESRGAARILEQGKLNAEIFAGEIRGLILDEEARRKLGAGIRSIHIPESAEKIAALLKETQ